MVVEYIRYALKDHTLDALITAYSAAGQHLQTAPECLAYELTICADAPDQAILRINWESPQAHLERFRAGPNFPPFLALVRPFIAEIAEMRHYTPTSVSWQR